MGSQGLAAAFVRPRRLPPRSVSPRPQLLAKEKGERQNRQIQTEEKLVPLRQAGRGRRRAKLTKSKRHSNLARAGEGHFPPCPLARNGRRATSRDFIFTAGAISL